MEFGELKGVETMAEAAANTIPIYVINVDLDVPIHRGREKRMRARLEKLGLLEQTTFVPAITKESPEVIASLPGCVQVPEWPFFATDIAHFLSHIKVIQLIANGTNPRAVIFEDDVLFPSNFAERFAHLQTLTQYDLISFSHFILSWAGAEELGDDLRHPTPEIYSSCGYLLTRVGARQILNTLTTENELGRFILPAEVQKAYPRRRIIADLIVNTVAERAAFCLPALVFEENIDSSVNDAGWNENHRRYVSTYGIEDFLVLETELAHDAVLRAYLS